MVAVHAADLNSDGAIGFDDFVFFASSFGEEAKRAPVFSATLPVTRTVEENTPSGQPIGDPVAAADADGDSLAYRLPGVATGRATITATATNASCRPN